MKKQLIKSLERSLADTLNSIEISDDEIDLIIPPVEIRLEALIFSLSWKVRKRYFEYRHYETIFFFLASIPSIFINLVKIYFNLIHGTLIAPCFDTSGHAQMIGGLGRLRIEVYPRDHHPPHFHVKTEHSNMSFLIDDCTPLSLRRGSKFSSHEIKAIQRWHSLNKEKLLDIWNKFHNC